MTLEAGTATIDITPPAGSLMAAFPRGPERTPRRAAGAHDPLCARILVLRRADECVALCACDLTAVRQIDVDRVRARVAERIPALAGRRVMLACSHSHSTAETTYLFGNTPDDPWVQDLDRRLADGVAAAHADLAPAAMRVGRAALAFSHNRRVVRSDGQAAMVLEHEEGVTTGPVDPELVVLRFDRPGGKPAAVLYSYAAHALTAGPRNDLYTADFPGVASAFVEDAWPGVTALFCNGGAGNVHPRQCMRDDFGVMEEAGARLGAAVVSTAQAAHADDVTDLRVASDVLSFANRVDPSLRVSVEVACIRLGGVAIGLMPGEPFIEFQMQFKAAVKPLTGVFVGYANAWVGYVPTREAYAHGGYGVELCRSDLAEWSRTALPPGAGESIVARLVAMAAA